MKKLLLTCAAALMAVGAWAETTLLYERGTTNNWQDSDISETEWAQQWNSSLAIVDNTLHSDIKNAGWNATKDITTTENSLVTFSATLFGGQAPGRSGSYDYIRIGGVELRLNGQDQKASVAIDGVVTNLSGFTRGGACTISGTINQASGAVTYTVTGTSTGSGSGTTNTAVTSAVFGHNRAGSEGYQIVSYLSKISISEEVQEVAMADYTISYMFDGASIKTVEGNTTVGNTVNAESPITIEGQKYYATSTTSFTVTDNADDNNFEVTLREAYVYSYSANSSIGTLVASGSGTEGETVNYAYSKYILQGTDLYEAAKQGSNPWWGKNLLLDEDNKTDVITYNKTVEDVVFYSEAENIEGATSTSAANAEIRCSGKAGASNGSLDITTLPAGKYVLYTSVWGNAGTTIRFNAGTTEIFAAETKGYIQDYNTEEFTLLENTTISFTGADNNHPVDFVYIKRTGDVTEVPVTVGANGFSSFYAPFALDFAGTNVVAYTVAANVAESTVTLTPVEKVPAGTPLIVGGATDNVPVIPSASAVVTDLQYAAAEVTNATAGATVYYLAKVNGEVGFRPLSESGSLAAGKCYFTAPSSAPSFRIVIEGMEDGNQTAISELNAATNAGAMFDLEGRKANGKGLMIQNGKVVLVK